MLVSLQHSVDTVDFNETFIAACDEGLIRHSGDRERICQQNGLLTGFPLRCFERGKIISPIETLFYRSMR